MVWDGELDRRKGERKGFRFRKDYVLLWSDLAETWRLYRMDESFMDNWASLIEHSCPKNGDVYSGHWTETCVKCTECGEALPDELVTAWKLHNADQMWRLNDL